MRDAEYREDVCKYIMEEKFPEKFSNLEKSESPDWHNSLVGLEVRRAILSAEAEFNAFFKKYETKLLSEIPTKLLEKYGFSGYPQKDYTELYMQRSDNYGSLVYMYDCEKNDYVLLAHVGTIKGDYDETGNSISNAIIDKLKKLNDHYTIYPENDLFIIIDEFIDYGIDIFVHFNEFFNPILKSIKDIFEKNTFKKVFDYIYLLFYDCIVLVSTKDLSYSYKKLSQSDWDVVKSKMNV